MLKTEMELGAEISQKIRSAIKAKLVDLGAYVDDELPDYIMVMVANKKNVAQMTADLNLFLGNNTDKFTTWLSSLLNKLQSVTTAEEKKEEPPIKESSSEPVLQLNAEPDERLDVEAESHAEKPQETVRPTVKSVSSKPMSRSTHRTSSSSSSTREHRGSRDQERDGAGAGTRKRKLAPISAVVSKVPEEAVGGSEDEEEEEYDPLNPAVGKVASVIRVTERKSSIPVTKQANKSLLMRAMKDAESSVSRVKVVRPMRKEVRRYSGEMEEEIVERRTVTAQPRPRTGHSASHRPRSQPQPQPSRSSHHQHHQQQQHQEPSSRIMSSRSSSTSSSRPSSSRPIQLYSRHTREQVKRHVSAVAAAAHNEDIVDYDEHTMEPVHKVMVLSQPQPASMRTSQAADIHVEEPGMEKVEEAVEEFELVMEPDALDWQLEEDEEIQQSLHSGGGRAPSPKFVVTLDGVDADKLDLESDGGQAMVEEEEERRNVVRVQPMRPVQPVMVRLQDEDGDSVDECEGEGSPPRVNDTKKVETTNTEKCRFFPNCKNGDACPYAHPTTPCTNFPNCRFGDKCLYVHPKCKYDAACSRPDCSFSHTAKRPQFPAPSPVPVIMPVPMYPAPRPKPRAETPVCRYYPRCTNLNCSFAHPKPCRFGMSCSRKSTCSFTHPALPAKDKLRWSANPTGSKVAPPATSPVPPTPPTVVSVATESP